MPRPLRYCPRCATGRKGGHVLTGATTRATTHCSRARLSQAFRRRAAHPPILTKIWFLTFHRSARLPRVLRAARGGSMEESEASCPLLWENKPLSEGCPRPLSVSNSGCTHSHTHTPHIYAHTHTLTYTLTNTHTHSHTHTFMHTHAQVYTHTHTHTQDTCTPTNTYTVIYVHTHTHTQSLQDVTERT